MAAAGIIQQPQAVGLGWRLELAQTFGSREAVERTIVEGRRVAVGAEAAGATGRGGSVRESARGGLARRVLRGRSSCGGRVELRSAEWSNRGRVWVAEDVSKGR